MKKKQEDADKEGDSTPRVRRMHTPGMKRPMEPEELKEDDNKKARGQGEGYNNSGASSSGLNRRGEKRRAESEGDDRGRGGERIEEQESRGEKRKETSDSGDVAMEPSQE